MTDNEFLLYDRLAKIESVIRKYREEIMHTPKTALSEKELGYCEYDCLVVYDEFKEQS